MLIDERLLDTRSWRLVSSLFPPERPAVRDAGHEAWMAGHSEAHPGREILFGVDGECLYGLNGAPYRCSPGTVFLFGSFEPHDYCYPDKTDGVTHFWMSLVPDAMFGRLLKVRNGKHEVLRGSMLLHDKELVCLLNRYWDEGSGGGRFARSRLLGALHLAMASMLELEAYSKERASTLNHQEKVIKAIERHIDETAGKGLTVESLAKLSGYSKFHFLRLFRKYTGSTVHGYIDAVRQAKAAEMLRHGDIKKTVAEKLGFSCPAAFSHWLKKQGEDAP